MIPGVKQMPSKGAGKKGTLEHSALPASGADELGSQKVTAHVALSLMIPESSMQVFCPPPVLLESCTGLRECVSRTKRGRVSSPDYTTGRRSRSFVVPVIESGADGGIMHSSRVTRREIMVHSSCCHCSASAEQTGRDFLLLLQAATAAREASSKYIDACQQMDRVMQLLCAYVRQSHGERKVGEKEANRLCIRRRRKKLLSLLTHCLCVCLLLMADAFWVRISGPSAEHPLFFFVGLHSGDAVALMKGILFSETSFSILCVCRSREKGSHRSEAVFLPVNSTSATTGGRTAF